MDYETIPQTGERLPGIVYPERPSVYGLAVNAAGRVLACRRSLGRLVLPGGGLAPGERAEDALVREVAEETGYRVVSSAPFMRARQYHNHRIAKPPVNKLCHFLTMEVAFDPAIRPEADHVPVWLEPRELLTALTFESHRLAVETLLAASQRDEGGNDAPQRDDADGVAVVVEDHRP